MGIFSGIDPWPFFGGASNHIPSCRGLKSVRFSGDDRDWTDQNADHSKTLKKQRHTIGIIGMNTQMDNYLTLLINTLDRLYINVNINELRY